MIFNKISLFVLFACCLAISMAEEKEDQKAEGSVLYGAYAPYYGGYGLYGRGLYGGYGLGYKGLGYGGLGYGYGHGYGGLGYGYGHGYGYGLGYYG